MNSDQTSSHFVKAIDITSLQEKKVSCVKVDGVSLAICLSKGEFYAVENLCTHAASTFDGGRIKGRFLICPLHGVMFDMASGEPRGSLTNKPLRTFATRVTSDGVLEVDISSFKNA